MASSSTPRRAAAPDTTGTVVDSTDWPAQAADTIERVVGTVRDKTTGPAISAARWIVYGTFALLVGMAVLVLLAIALVRMLDVYLPDAVFGEEHTWAAHLIVGILFSLAGMAMWSKRRARADAKAR